MMYASFSKKTQMCKCLVKRVEIIQHEFNVFDQWFCFTVVYTMHALRQNMTLQNLGQVWIHA